MANTFMTLGVAIEGGQVRKLNAFGVKGAVLGPLAGAQAEISDPTRHRRVGGPLAATAVTAPILGPLALLGMASKKSKSLAFVVFPDGTVHEKKLDGNMAIRAATREVVQFNALARATGAASVPSARRSPRPHVPSRVSGGQRTCPAAMSTASATRTPRSANLDAAPESPLASGRQRVMGMSSQHLKPIWPACATPIRVVPS